MSDELETPVANYKKLYKRDARGDIRVWWMEQKGDKYRAHSGLYKGEIITSTWRLASPKNIGTAAATTTEEQATKEILAQYEKQYKKGYFKSCEDIDTPIHFRPMLAKNFSSLSESKLQLLIDKMEVYIQPKLDGIRCIATPAGLFTRSGNKILTMPHIQDALESFFERHPEYILDGELYNHDLNEDFNSIVSIVRKQRPTHDDLVRSKRYMQYHIFDCVNTDKPGRSFHLRHADLSWMLFVNEDETVDSDRVTAAAVTKNGYVHNVSTYLVNSLEDLDEKAGRFIQAGYEGSMIRLNAPYRAGPARANQLLKLKQFQDKEYKILNILSGEGNWADAAKRVVCELPNENTFTATPKGSFAYLQQVLAEKHLYKQATVRFQNLTPDGYPRFPIATRLYKDERDF